jgi:hypothetical protein
MIVLVRVGDLPSLVINKCFSNKLANYIHALCNFGIVALVNASRLWRSLLVVHRFFYSLLPKKLVLLLVFLLRLLSSWTLTGTTCFIKSCLLPLSPSLPELSNGLV